MTDDILFASLKIDKPDVRLALAQLRAIPESYWIWDYYLATSVLPLMTATGEYSRKKVRSNKATFANGTDFIWTELAPKVIVEYFESTIFKWLSSRPRITILRTPPGAANREHIDCSPADLGTRQHKLRIVLSGEVESLYFLTNAGRVYAPSTKRPFIMDGSWPHGMENSSSEEKITICVGAPWTGNSQYPEFEKVITKNPYQKPDDFEKYFNDYTFKEID